MLWTALIISALVVVAYCCIIVGKASDTLDNTADEHAEHLFVGGTFHVQPATETEERNLV